MATLITNTVIWVVAKLAWITVAAASIASPTGILICEGIGISISASSSNCIPSTESVKRVDPLKTTFNLSYF